MSETLPVSVVIPTIGRPALLTACLESLTRCRPAPAEVLVVDQSGTDEVAGVVSSFASRGVRHIASRERGVGVGRNLGFREATHDLVLVTDDDCVVAADWVERAYAHGHADPDTIVTGRVLAAGDTNTVPFAAESETAMEFRSPRSFSVLCTANMAAHRAAVLAIGAFDERIAPAATDNELCYRWLKAGKTIRYQPDVRVWHHDWRTPEDLERRYVGYAVGEGMFFAKHLLRGDPVIARRCALYVYLGLRGTAARLLRGRRRSTDWRQGILRGLPVGLARGFVAFGLRGGRR